MFDAIDLAALRGLGLSAALLQPLLEQAATDPGSGGLTLMRVVGVERNHALVADGHAQAPAHVPPALAPLVGDWALVRQCAPDEGGWRIERLLPARNQLVRRTTRGTRQPLVANVDTALLVMGLDGDYNAARLLRYLAMVAAAGVEPVVVLTKADRHPERAGPSLAALRAALPPHTAALALNTLVPEAAARLAPWLAEGRTLVMLGSSGAGKSSLTNTLLGAAIQRTGPVRADDSRGRHHTTARTLHLAPCGACLIDTPGLRALHLDAGEAPVQAVFADIVALAGRCRFRDCEHRDEPGCAVRAAVAPARLAQWHKLMRESAREAGTPLAREQMRAEWAARSRAVRAAKRAALEPRAWERLP